MKHDWEYKKLGDICDKGSSNISLNKIEDNIGEYALFGASGYVKDIDFYHNETPYIGIVKDGSGCGRVNIYPAKSSLVGTMQYIYPKQNCDIKFLMYLLQSLDLSSLVTGAAIPHIYFKDYSKFSIPVPPLPTQQSIVSELDSLSQIIADCKETLKDYDALEQSIFYDMFGDPVKNEKGWEVKKLGEVCSKITDGTHSSPENTSEGDRMYITAKNIKKDGIELKNITYVSEVVHRSIYDRCNPEYGDVLYIKDGITTGIATINTLNEEFTLLSSVALIKVGDNLNNYFLKGLMNFESFYEMVRGNMGGAAITRLTLAKINNITIILPPLPLQQQFASKIEAIEKMKSETKKALQEAETLFQARMDYWFN